MFVPFLFDAVPWAGADAFVSNERMSEEAEQ